MKISDTISVNPGKTTMGHVENSASIFRNPVLEDQSSRHSINLTKVLFPTIGSGVSEYRKYEVPLRTLFATILIIAGLTAFTSAPGILGAGAAICSLCFGGCLALGLFTRPVMFGAAVYYCIAGALALRGGTVDMTLFSLMFGCLVFAVVGAGKYSIDTLIRHGIISHQIASEKRRKEDLMGYKAFHNVKF